MVNESPEPGSERVPRLEAAVAVAVAVFGSGCRRPLAAALGASHATLNAVAGGGPMSPALKRRLGRWAAEVRAVEREEARRRLRLLALMEEWDDLEAE